MQRYNAMRPATETGVHYHSYQSARCLNPNEAMRPESSACSAAPITRTGNEYRALADSQDSVQGAKLVRQTSSSTYLANGREFRVSCLVNSALFARLLSRTASLQRRVKT